jgi:hypothetical protein
MTRRDKGAPHTYPAHAHCSQIYGTIGRVVDPAGNLFCATCPDAAKIPEGCRLNCGYPYFISARGAMRCPYIETCPCASEDSPERTAAIARFNEGIAERVRMIKEAVK